MKEISRSENVFQLKILQQYLSDHDIQSVIMDEHTGTLMSGIGNILPRLMILEEDFERALELIKKQEGLS